MDSAKDIYSSGGPASIGSAVHAAYNPLSGPRSWYDTLHSKNTGPVQPFQQSDMVQDPATGLWVNKNTGLIYSDPNGQRPVSNLDLHQLNSRASAVSNNLYGQAGGSLGTQNQAIGGEFNLVNSLQDVVNGTAPSAAQNQLGQGMDAIAAAQRSQAAGATGQNAPLANLAAANNIANAQLVQNQQAAQLRAQDVAQARAQQGVTLGQIGSLSGQTYGNQLGAAGQSQGQAIQAQGSAEGATAAANDKNKDLVVKGGGMALSALV